MPLERDGRIVLLLSKHVVLPARSRSAISISHALDAVKGLDSIIFAKEQYTRRGQCVNLWVVKTSDVMVTEYLDSDIFETTESKTYRDPNSYKVMDRIKAFKERQTEA